MKYIRLTNGGIVKVDDEDYDFLTQWNWQNSQGYAIRRLNGGRVNGKKVNGGTVMMHRIINKTPVGLDTDHINGNPLDNRRCNLRTVTVTQNNANQRPQVGKTSKYKGVYLDRGMWRAAISCNKNAKKLGYFPTEISAALAYNSAAKELFGDYARLNEIPLTIVGRVHAV